MTARDALDAATTALDAAGCMSPRLDAELLIADALGMGRERLFLYPDMEIPPPAARVIAEHVRRRNAEMAADRRSQVGTGERAEKIRTYNYGERRVTDHRIKLTAHNLDQVLEGELDEFTAALQADERRRALQAQAEADAVR